MRRRQVHNNPQRRARAAVAVESAGQQPLARPATTSSTLCLWLLFFSGVTALVYQVLWTRQLTLLVGIDVYAVSTVVSAFFAGLALGGFYFGRMADRLARPLLLYAWLEIGCALAGFLATWALANIAPLFNTLENQIGVIAWLLPATLIAAPAALMGGTLPAALRASAPEHGRIGQRGGTLYAMNTIGAMCGALLVTFVLIPKLGVLGGAAAAAKINLALALFAFIGAARSTASARDKTPVADDGKYKLALILYALAGAIGLGYEVVWSQAITPFVSMRGFAFSILLAIYLGALVLGSALYARCADRARDPWGAFALLIAGAGLLALLQTAALGPWLPRWQAAFAQAVHSLTGNELAAMCARFSIAGFALVFAPAALLGAAFPAALRLGGTAARIGRDSGAVIALNTAGGIVGTLLTGFVLLPAFGLVRTLGLLAALAAVIGIYAAARGVDVRARRAVALIALLSLASALLIPKDQFARQLIDIRGGHLLRYEESAGATTAVVEQRANGRSFRRLYIQGVSNSGDTLASLRYMRLQALLPLLITREPPRSALVIALGTGITAGALTRYPGLDRRVCVELLPSVVRAAPLFNGNYGVGATQTETAVEIRVGDGRRELARNPERFDVITLEPPPPSAAGVANLYSRDFYQLARARLQPGGLFAQWLPLATQNDEDTRALVRSFLDVFPHATLWTTELHEMLLIGSAQPIELDAARITQRFYQGTVAASLREIGIDSPAALLATWVTDRAGLEQYAAMAEPVTDDRPRIEYAPWLRPGEFARVLPRLLALRGEHPLRADPAFNRELEQQRNRLLAFYAAGIHAYRGEHRGWSETLRMLAPFIDSNPYFRWIAGG